MRSCPTCRRSSAATPKQCEHVLANIDKLVVKPTNESGGYGIMLGPRGVARKSWRHCREQIRANPRNYIAQPMLSLSRVPTIVDDQLEGRHVDLRPYILYGKEIYVLPGGLTACGLQEGLAGRQFVARGRQQRHLGAQERQRRGNEDSTSSRPAAMAAVG